MKNNNRTLKKYPLVSIIMSEYNTDPELLKNSIESLINQTYINLEIIIIDDCGRNDLSSILLDFNDDRIKCYKNEKNSGLIYSLNKAIKLSSGEFIARMDTDDYAYPDRIEKEVEFLNNNTKYDVVSSNADYYDGKVIWGRTTGSGEITRKKLLNGSPIIHPTIMFRKSIFKSDIRYMNYNRCEDYALWIELYSKGFKLYKIKNQLIKYHLSLSDYSKRGLKARKDYFRLLKTQYKKLNPNRFNIIKMYLKTFIGGILPHSIMFNYHKKKMNKK